MFLALEPARKRSGNKKCCLDAKKAESKMKALKWYSSSIDLKCCLVVCGDLVQEL